MKKTKPDKTIFALGIAYSAIFLFPLFSNKNLWNSKIWIFLLSLGLILVFLGVWKYEYFKFNDKQIMKYNFFGLFVRKYSLSEMESYKNRFINMDNTKNPMNILYFFRKDSKKYLVFNIMKVNFKDGIKLKIDERSMPIKDFINIKKTIKKYKITRLK